MKKGDKREVSDKVIIALLVVAVIVSIFGAYAVYDYSHSYGGPVTNNIVLESSATGFVGLNVVADEIKEEGVEGNEGIE